MDAQLPDQFVLAVDPGLLSGVALFRIRDRNLTAEPELVGTWEVSMRDFPEVIRQIFDTVDYEQGFLDIVCERFVINAETHKKTQSPFSLEVIGMIKLIMIDAGLDPDMDLTLTNGSDAKSFTNAKLRKLGYWHVGGKGHALDAIRHGLLFLVMRGWKAVRLLR